MTSEDKSDHQEEPVEIKILKGQPIWLETTEDCDLLGYVCVLPNAWNLLTQLARGTIKKSNLAYLREERHGLLSIKRNWEALIYGSNKTTSQIEEDLAKLDQDSGLLHLFAALNALSNVWENDDKSEALRAVVNIPETLGGATEVSTNDAILVLRPGSLDAVIGWKGAYIASKWLIALWTRRGRVPSQIADDIVKNFRQRRSGERTLSMTREVQPAQIRGKCGIVIFIHGLMSTDAGLFDQLINELESDSYFKEHYLLLGFPHDTFASITANADFLLAEIDYLLLDNSETPLAFVCHSRGGLLARKVASCLYETEPTRWKKQLVGCVTFGTPHHGTPLAEYPSQLLGAAVTAIRAGQPGGFMGASDVLALVAAYGGIMPGIADLQPPAAIGKGPQNTTFVSDLRHAERSAAQKHQCRLQVLAIGGTGPHNSRIAWMTDKIFRNVPHDCAVELSSSAPERNVGVTRHQVCSDHFSYFTGRVGFPQAIEFIKQRMNYEECRNTAPSNPAALKRNIKAGKPILPKRELKEVESEST